MGLWKTEHNGSSRRPRPCMLRPDFMALAVQINDDRIPHPLELTQFAPLIKIYTKIDFPK